MFVELIDDELKKKLDEYKSIFLDIFPLMQFNGTRQELIEEINRCIETKEEYDTSFWDENPDIED